MERQLTEQQYADLLRAAGTKRPVHDQHAPQIEEKRKARTGKAAKPKPKPKPEKPAKRGRRK